jgi:ribosomal-protein-alanine N-acetyltransferase
MAETCEVRVARPADALRIAQMSRDFIEDGLGWRWTSSRIAGCMRDRAMNVVVAEADAQLVGFGIMQYHDLEAHLMLFAVVPEARRRGVGSQLLHWLEQVAVIAGIELIFLEARVTNLAAREFYRARGYRELALMRRYYSQLEDAVRIGKDLQMAPLPLPGS